MNIPVRVTQIINGRKAQEHVCWIISYDVDFGTWLKRKIHDQPLHNSSLLCETVRYANICLTHKNMDETLFKQIKEAKENLVNYELYLNKMKEKKARKDARRAIRIATEERFEHERLEKAARKLARKLAKGMRS